MLDRPNNPDGGVLVLPDRRRLCHAEYGDPGGSALFVFHGTPNSKLIWGFAPPPTYSGMRIIAPDRPGYGRTDFRSGVTTLSRWPMDIAALADHLGIHQFAVFGASSGGPYALACAWKIPDRVTCAGVFASLGPYDQKALRHAALSLRVMWRWAPRLSGLLRVQMRVIGWIARRHPRTYARLVRGEFGGRDQEVYDRLGLAHLLQPDRNESYRQGGIGIWYDAMISRNWPIPLEQIELPVYLWHGAEDISVPPAVGRLLAQRLPQCMPTFLEGAGHFWILEHLSEVLSRLVSPASVCEGHPWSAPA